MTTKVILSVLTIKNKCFIIKTSKILDILTIYHGKVEKMRFDYEAYGKVFPAQQPQTPTDSAVDGYNPTQDEAKTKPKVESAVEVEATNNTPPNSAQPTGSHANTNNGINEPKEGKTPTEGKNEPLNGDSPKEG